MRIVAGALGGRALQTPKGKDIRPTGDKIRGAMFNILRGLGAVEGAHVLDAFCGTGALGLEALSQGAESCVFVDKAKASLGLARENAENLGVLGQSEFILKNSVSSSLAQKSAKSFDLVFLDPPYRKELIVQTLDNLCKNESFSNNAICVIEAEKGFELGVIDGFLTLQEKIYGDTTVIFLRYVG